MTTETNKRIEDATKEFARKLMSKNDLPEFIGYAAGLFAKQLQSEAERSEKLREALEAENKELKRQIGIQKMELDLTKTLGYVDIVKMIEGGIDGDREKVIRHAKRYLEKYPDRDLCYPLKALLEGNKNPDNLTLI